MGIFDFFKNKQVNEEQFNEEVVTLEISKKEMDKLCEDIKDEEGNQPENAKSKIFHDKEKKPFSGLLISKKTDDEGRIECEYLDGNRHGEYIKYDDEDENKIYHTKYYKNGLLHGPFTYWWEKYKDGKKPKEDKDTPKFGDANLDAMVGSILKKHDVMVEINYKDGLLHGKWIQFNFNGGIEYETSYKNGKKDGIWRGYFDPGIFGGQGRLKQVSVYKENKLISSKYYDFDGEEVDLEDVIDDEEWGGEIF